jgi:hypothetical protein
MTAKTKDRFKEFGIPPDAFESGKPVEAQVLLYDLEQLRDLLTPGLDEGTRTAVVDALFDGIEATSEEDQLLQRARRFVFGEGELSAEDREAVTVTFPLAMEVFLAPEPMVVKDKWDISTTDGTMRVVDISDLTIEQGGYIVCSGTPLSFTCKTLTRTGNTGTNMADFNILGRTPATPSTPAPPGEATQAAKGKNGECSSAGIAGSGGQRGTSGARGTPGTPGTRGRDGIPSQETSIYILEKMTADKLTFFTQSGPGGQGGDGGPGGKGQQGGNGGDGRTCGCTGNGGGPGADGGQGGDGGAAGHGGNGVDAVANIYVQVPTQDDVPKVTQLSQLAPPGNAGNPGPGGAGGAGGSGGSGGKHNSGGGRGGTGGPGAYGAQGSPGTASGRAAQVIVQKR